MSRIWKLPITIPAGVTVTIEDQKVTVKGPKWSSSLELVPVCHAHLEGDQLTISLTDPEKKNMRGLSRTLVANMVHGVTHGYEIKLHVIGIGYAVKVQGQKLILNVWLSHAVEHILPPGITASVERDPKGSDILTIMGIDKQAVGQETAKIKTYRQPEPYKGKGIRYFGESIKLKAGKTAAKK